MEIKITTSEIAKISILNKTILILFGLFISSSLFAICLKTFKEWGLIIGLILGAFIVFLGLYYTNKGSKLRVVIYSILGTIILGIIGYMIGLQFLAKTLEGF